VSLRAESEHIDYTDLDLQELAELSAEVTSAAKKPQSLLETPSAVYVITAEEIRRSGHTLLPEILRLVPGMNVHRAANHYWGVSARGSLLDFSRFLLVLIDGRSVYTPLFGGTFWEQQDLAVEDIERIEVIRGPGGSVWGANATNGIVNVIRRDPDASLGSHFSVKSGSEERLQTSFGHTTALRDDLFFRWSGRYSNRAATATRDGHAQDDEQRQATTHLRLDWLAGEQDRVTLQGDLYGGDLRLRVRKDNALSAATGCDADSSVPACFGIAGYRLHEESVPTTGGNALVRWQHQHAGGSTSELQAYWDTTFRDSVIIKERRATFDLELRNRWLWAGWHDVAWGVGGRLLKDRTRGSFNIAVADRSEDEAIYNAFAQDEIALAESLRLTLGSKLEFNTYTGWEVHGTTRLMWKAAERHHIWTALSRVVRIPSRSEQLGFTVTPAVVPGGGAISIRGVRRLDSEKMVASELGYRWQPLDALYFDAALFLHDYENYRDVQTTPGSTSGVDLGYTNRDELRSYGVELLSRARPFEPWQLTLGWTHIQETGTSSGSANETVPHHQLRLSSFLDLPGNVQLDLDAYYVGRLTQTSAIPAVAIDGYWRHDARLAWQPTPNFEVSLVGQNLFERQHLEYAVLFTKNAAPVQDFGNNLFEIERAWYLQCAWRF